MSVIQICGVGIVCAVASVVVRQLRQELATPVRLCGTLLLFGAIIALLYPLLGYVGELLENSSLSRYSQILIKALGISYISYIGSEICSECGENGVAGLIELAGRCEILILAMPLFDEILDVAEAILGWRA